MENNFGRKHVAPKEYTYVLKCGSEYSSHFINALTLHTKEYTSIGNTESPSGAVIFSDGLNKIMDKDVFIINQKKQGYYYFWFKSKDDANEIFVKLGEIAKKKEFIKKKSNLQILSVARGMDSSKFVSRKKSNRFNWLSPLFGLDFKRH